MYHYNRNNNFNYTGKLYGNDGRYFTITTQTKDGLKEAGPFIHVNSFPEHITLQMFKYFLGDKANAWIELFGEDIIKKHLKTLRPRSFLTIDFYEDKGNYGGLAGALIWSRGWLLGKYTTYPCVEWKGEWKREYTGEGYQYIHASQYETWKKSFMEKCLRSKFPYLSQFKFDAYGFSFGEDNKFGSGEFYIHCDAGDSKHGMSLYVPFGALVENDFKLVEDRMRSYFVSYYNKPEQKEYLITAISLLESQEAKLLKRCFAKAKRDN